MYYFVKFCIFVKMNIFYLSEDITKCAEYHVDKHVVKMPLETAQLLCTVHWICGGEAPYRKTHINHPSSRWVRHSIENYRWLCKLGKALCREYTHRYGKIHKCEQIIDWCTINEPVLPKLGFTTPTPAMADEFKLNNSLLSYRNYYINGKSHLASWKNRCKPKWYEV